MLVIYLSTANRYLTTVSNCLSDVPARGRGARGIETGSIASWASTRPRSWEL